MDVIKLVEKHRGLLSEWDRKQHTFKSKYRPGQKAEQSIDSIPGKPWTLLNLIQLLAQYPSGLSEAVLRSELEVLWDQAQPEFHTGNEQRAVASFATQLMSKTRGAVLLLDDDLKYELRILSVEKLPGSTIDILVVADNDIELSSIGNLKYRIEAILHSKFLPLLNRGMFNETRFQKRSSVSLKIAGSLHVEIRQDSLFRLLPTINVVFNLHAGWEQFTSLLGRDPIVPLVDLPGYIRQAPGDMAQIGLWMKIVSIQALNPQRLRRVVEVQDASVKEPVAVIFSQAQVSLVRTLEVGGYLGLYFPRVAYSGVKVILEVEPATYLFYADPEGGNVGFKIEETKDQTFRLPQMTLKDIGPDMSAITMLVQIVTFTRNVPLKDPKGDKHHRCTLVVEDSTGISYVTFWEQAVAAIAESCIPGHLLLLQGIHTTAAPSQALPSNVFINAHPNERFQFTNISTLKGVFNTLSVASKILLTDLDSWFSSNINKTAYYVGECLITACIPVMIPNALQDKWFFTVQTRIDF
ncbi:hypothetical protein DSO57_1028490 [Entomophthora muscae]|uniref:Uncharacterized protein n=1 Tax=Entomophthora muscae TaxID=34485 RepID=A0ACC2RG65_9FUNG|nr:hypothetical protein DSO57_1028490 [Entomophthora muscae]